MAAVNFDLAIIGSGTTCLTASIAARLGVKIIRRQANMGNL